MSKLLVWLIALAAAGPAASADELTAQEMRLKPITFSCQISR